MHEHTVTISVELGDGTLVEKVVPIERIGNRAFVAYETRKSIEDATESVLKMLTADMPTQLG